MKNTTYLEQVKADIENYLDNTTYFDLENMILENDFEDVDDIREYLNDTLWIEDSVTGNASGSYTFNREEAKENVLADMDTVREALTEFCVTAEEIGERFLNEDWEYLDVTARCYVLGQAIEEYLEENAEAIEEIFEKKENNVW